MIPKIPVEPDDDDDAAPPTRLWRRPGVVMIAVAIVAVVGYAVVHSKEEAKHTGSQTKSGSDSFIGEVVAYQPPVPIKTARADTMEKHADQPSGDDEPIPPPPPPPPAPPTPIPPAPTPPPLRNLMPQQIQGQQQAPQRNKMMVYALPPIAQSPAPPTPPAETSVAFKTSDIPGLKASPAIDDTYQLMPGLLPMVLDSAISSDVPGRFYAHLPGPIYSRHGVKLMDVMTQIVGSYGSMGKGSRLMTASAFAWVPTEKGMVWVPLTDQSMSDDLGRAGLPGEVDRHLLPRFGPAVLLTLTGQGLSILQAEASKGGNTYLNLSGSGGGGGGGVESLASQILQSQINIPDTFNKHQGEWIALSLDRPIDFSASYKIHEVKAQ